MFMKIFAVCKRGHSAKKILALDKNILETQFNIDQCDHMATGSSKTATFSKKVFQEITANTYKKYHIHTTAHLVNTRETDDHDNHISLCFEQLRPSNIAHCSELSSRPHPIK